MAGSDLVLVIDYGKRKVIDEIAVGEHPQRVRDGLVSRLGADVLGRRRCVQRAGPVTGARSRPAQLADGRRVDGRSDRGHQLAASAELGQALGRLPWLALFFLRARRLRPVLLMVILRGFGNGAVSQAACSSAKSRSFPALVWRPARVADRARASRTRFARRCAVGFADP